MTGTLANPVHAASLALVSPQTGERDMPQFIFAYHGGRKPDTPEEGVEQSDLLSKSGASFVKVILLI